MKKKYNIILFVLIAVIQLTVISYVVVENHIVMVYGKEIKIKTMPIDPHDIFRGKYINLNINNTVSKQPNIEIKKERTVYVTFKTDEAGFSELYMAHTVKPKNMLYVKTKASENATMHTNTIIVNNLFDRFYMNEAYSAQAENIYRQHSADHTMYIVVKILNGKSLIENVYINAQTIQDFIETIENQ